MSTLANRRSWIDEGTDPVPAAGAAAEAAAFPDLAANTRDTAGARLVHQYFGSVLPVRPSGAPQSPAQPTIGTIEDERPAFKAPLLPERRSTRIVSYHALQEWEGYVTSISSDTFTADLVDMTRAAKQADEQVELDLDEIGVEQRGELQVGAVFRWTIGYETLPSGQRRRVSQLVFRQLPKWTEVDIDAAQRQGAERHGRIKWE
jgi:hypothetical protein